MGNQYLVMSDLHLCDVEEHADGWKAYKRARYVIDDEFASLLDHTAGRFEAGAREPGSGLTLVLNGDIVDFDLVVAVPEEELFEVSPHERKRGMMPTAEKSAWKLERVLADHQGFVEALARFAARGHAIVYVMGNHDRELHFPEVQRVLVRAMRAVAAERGLRLPSEPIRFEPWFHHVPGEIYAEHGQQYDHYASFRYVLSPVVQTRRHGPVIALPMGDLANRYLITMMGFFNPHASDFILNVFCYAAHWFRHYAFSKRGIVWNWFWGSVLVMTELLAMKKRIHTRPLRYDACLAHAARRANLPLSTIRALGALQPPPITTRFYRIAREFWIDRLLIAVLMLVGSVVLALSPVPLWVKLMVPLSSFPLLYFVYEWLAKGDTIFTIEHEVPRYARRVADLVGVKVVTFGHTHRPRIIPLDPGTSFVDTGTWAPILAGSEPVPGYRNYLFVHFDRGEPSVKLDVWKTPRAAAAASVVRAA
jgi:UDP-2,3-diacylglucosamine pyrophosphatase LpxH